MTFKQPSKSALDKIAEDIAAKHELIRGGIPCQEYPTCTEMAAKFSTDGFPYCLSHGPKCSTCGLDAANLRYWSDRALKAEREVLGLRNELDAWVKTHGREGVGP